VQSRGEPSKHTNDKEQMIDIELLQFERPKLKPSMLNIAASSRDRRIQTTLHSYFTGKAVQETGNAPETSNTESRNTNHNHNDNAAGSGEQTQLSWQPIDSNTEGSSPTPAKAVVVPLAFNRSLSATPSPITSPILSQHTYSTSVHGHQRKKTILSNIDPLLMSTLEELNNDELELNLSLTMGANSTQFPADLSGANEQSATNQLDGDGTGYYERYRQHMTHEYSHIDRRKHEMKDLGQSSKLRRIYFRELCIKSFPDAAYNYLNPYRIESLSLYTGDTASLIAFISKCGQYPIIKKIELDGRNALRCRCAPLCEALTKCVNLCSLQLPSIVDAVDIIAFDALLSASVNLSEVGLITGDRQLFKPIHDVIHKHGFRMAINPSGLRYIYCKRKNKQVLRQKYQGNKQKLALLKSNHC